MLVIIIMRVTCLGSLSGNLSFENIFPFLKLIQDDSLLKTSALLGGSESEIRESDEILHISTFEALLKRHPVFLLSGDTSTCTEQLCCPESLDHHK